jgi:hypothetical protein
MLIIKLILILISITLIYSYIYNQNHHFIKKFNKNRLFLSSSSSITILDNDWKSILEKNPNGLRLFHPAFPNNVNNPLNAAEADEIIRLRTLLGSNLPSKDDLNSLPWLPLPTVGLSSTQPEKELWSRSEVNEVFERYKHTGFLIWAYKVNKIEKGVSLLNHWKQSAIHITEFGPDTGAKANEMKSNYSSIKYITWPPLALEMELDQDKWQPVVVSPNIASGEIFSYLPEEMPKAPWELILLCLISKSSEPETYQALFDTGLSPKQGLIAYLRLLEAVQLRLEQFEGVPSYRKIHEKTLKN